MALHLQSHLDLVIILEVLKQNHYAFFIGWQ